MDGRSSRLDTVLSLRGMALGQANEAKLLKEGVAAFILNQRSTCRTNNLFTKATEIPVTVPNRPQAATQQRLGSRHRERNLRRSNDWYLSV